MCTGSSRAERVLAPASRFRRLRSTSWKSCAGTCASRYAFQFRHTLQQAERREKDDIWPIRILALGTRAREHPIVGSILRAGLFPLRWWCPVLNSKSSAAELAEAWTVGLSEPSRTAVQRARQVRARRVRRSFNGKFRDECLKLPVASQKLVLVTAGSKLGWYRASEQARRQVHLTNC